MFSFFQYVFTVFVCECLGFGKSDPTFHLLSEGLHSSRSYAWSHPQHQNGRIFERAATWLDIPISWCRFETSCGCNVSSEWGPPWYWFTFIFTYWGLKALSFFGLRQAKSKMKCLSLFSGVGGLELGVRQPHWLAWCCPSLFPKIVIVLHCLQLIFASQFYWSSTVLCSANPVPTAQLGNGGVANGANRWHKPSEVSQLKNNILLLVTGF